MSHPLPMSDIAMALGLEGFYELCERLDDYPDVAYEAWSKAVHRVAFPLYEAHGLRLSEPQEGECTLSPVEGWEEALESLKQTINGLGPFYFESIEELIAEGAFPSVEDAVRSRLNWIKYWPKVHGGISASLQYQQELRFDL